MVCYVRALGTGHLVPEVSLKLPHCSAPTIPSRLLSLKSLLIFTSYRIESNNIFRSYQRVNQDAKISNLNLRKGHSKQILITSIHLSRPIDPCHRPIKMRQSGPNQDLCKPLCKPILCKSFSKDFLSIHLIN